MSANGKIHRAGSLFLLVWQRGCRGEGVTEINSVCMRACMCSHENAQITSQKNTGNSWMNSKCSKGLSWPRLSASKINNRKLLKDFLLPLLKLFYLGQQFLLGNMSLFLDFAWIVLNRLIQFSGSIRHACDSHQMSAKEKRAHLHPVIVASIKHTSAHFTGNYSKVLKSRPNLHLSVRKCFVANSNWVGTCLFVLVLLSVGTVTGSHRIFK